MGWAEGYGQKPEGLDANRKDADFWTPDFVEGRLIEAIAFLDRVVPSGRNPYATDGPWSKIVRHRWIVVDPSGEVPDYIDVEDRRDRLSRDRGGLNVAQYERMSEALEWAMLVQDRKGRLRPLLGVVLQQKQHHGNQVDWAEVKRRLRSKDTHDCLRVAYTRALSAIAVKLNAKGLPLNI